MVGGRILTRVAIAGFKTLRSVAVDLSPFTVVVGGNATGKTSLLAAISLLQGAAAEPGTAAGSPVLDAALHGDAGSIEGVLSFGMSPPALGVQGWLTPPLPHRGARLRQDLSVVHCGVRVELVDERPSLSSHFRELPAARLGEPTLEGDWKAWTDKAAIEEVRARQRESGMGPVPNLRLDTRALSWPSPVRVGEARLGDDGSNLAAVLRDIRDREDGSFAEIEEALRRVVPIVRQLRVPKVDVRDGRAQMVPAFGIEARVGDASHAWCPAHELSEGTLMTLAILTAMFVSDGPRMVLLDDIDRGLHPRAQRELIELLRAIMKTHLDLQIVCTTHSPYTVDAFDLDEVVALKLDENASAHAQRLSDHPDADKWRELMQAGEFWTSVGEDWVFGA